MTRPIARPGGVPPLGSGTKLLYGVGSLSYGIKDAAFRTFLVWYYNQVIGAPVALISGAVFFALLVDAVSDPVVGQLSDRLRTKWGRRHPLMYASALPAAASFLLLWMPPEGLSGTGLFWYVVVVSSLVRTFITFYEIPSSALAPELASDYDERTTLASYRYLFGYLGGYGMAALALFVFLRPTEGYPVGQLNPAGYMTFGIVGAALMLGTVLLSTIGTHNRIPYLSVPEKREGEGVIRTFQHIFRTFRHGGFLAILTFGVMKYTAIGITGALSLYFATYFWGLNAWQVGVLTFEGIVAAGAAFVVGPVLSRRMGKRAGAVALAVAAVLFAMTPFALRFAGAFWPNGHPALLPSLFVFQALYVSCGAASAMLVHSMIGDVVDERAVATGRRAEGLFYAANSLMQKCSSGLGVFAAGLLLAAVGMPEGGRGTPVPPEVIRDLALVYVPTLLVLYCGGAVFLKFYHIDRERQAATRATIEAGAPPVKTTLAS
ncbi:MFS transporter [Parvularcula oceani]|uniref:MFS transporter n=1 Tax=Parvularcula oceani TaxID=1247963 RepID=UPI0006901190|nr:MFS transporter [Parvularcula oceani]